MVAPLAPLLLGANGATLDADGEGVTEAFTFRPGAPGDTLAAYRYRRRIAGSTTYEWWNGTTAFVLMETNVLSTDDEIVVPPGEWPNGDVYQVAVATRNQGGEWGPYSAERLLIASTPPVLTLTHPASPVLSSRPEIRWTFTDAEGDAMEAVRLLAFTPAVYGAVGFDPDDDAALALFDTGKMLTSTLDRLPAPDDLPDEDDIRVYGRAWQTGDQPGPWAYKEFDVTLTIPNAPSVIAVADNLDGEIDLAVAASLNLLTADEADLEGIDSGDLWERDGDSYGAPERTTAWSSNGAAALRVGAFSTFDVATAHHVGLGDSFDDASASYPTFGDFAATLF